MNAITNDLFTAQQRVSYYYIENNKTKSKLIIVNIKLQKILIILTKVENYDTLTSSQVNFNVQ